MRSMKSKKSIIKFVDEVAEMETKAFTLQQLAEQIRIDADNKVQEQKQICAGIRLEEQDAEEKCKQQKHRIEYIKTTEDDMPQKAAPSGCMGVILGTVAFFILLVVFATVIAFSGAGEMTVVMILAVGPLLFPVFLIVGFFVWKQIDDGNKEKAHCAAIEQYEMRRAQLIKNEEKKLDTFNNELNAVHLKYRESLDRLELIKQERESAYQVAQKCDHSSKQVYKRLSGLYSLTKIIPPDYRKMDCVLTFQQIFRNDLADDMRRAQEIYDERVFRGELIRGMKEIYERLGRLNSSMEYMQRTLISIHNNVSMMSQDVFRFTQTMDSVNSTQERILEQAKATRYAAEAVQQSQDKCEEYMKKFSA